MYILDLVYLFFIYSIAGWLIEVTLKYFQFHRFINRGFFTLPWLPIYGSGCALITLASDGLIRLSAAEGSYGTVFALSFFLCGLLEYFTSFFMEKRFHARWWDYSTKPMNLHGRIWIGNLILFGLGGLITVKFTNPLIYALLDRMPLAAKQITAAVLTLLFVSDYLMTHFILSLVKRGVESSVADNTEEISLEIKALLTDKNLFARRFASAYPEVIYRTDKVKSRLEEIKKEAEQFATLIRENAVNGRQEMEEKLRKRLKDRGEL